MTEAEHERSRHRWGPDCERTRVAAEITGPIRHGVIDGVTVDFRHPAIEPDDWEPRPWWHMAGASEDSARIGFASDSDIGIPKIKGAFYPTAGDTLSISNIRKVSAGPTFKHEHDRELIEAGLVCQRANGQEESLEWPLRFYGVRSMTFGRAYNAFETIEARSAEEAGLTDLDDGPSSHFHARRAGVATEAAFFARSARSLEREIKNIVADKEILIVSASDGWLHDIVDELLDTASLAGYFLARAQSEGLEDEKIRSLEILEKGRLTNKDYDNRRVRAQELWDGSPKLTINRVAQLIAMESGKDKASVMASIWEVVPPTSPSYEKALKKRRQ